MPAEKKNPVADALRKAGFIPLPRLWVQPVDMPRIHEIAHRYKDAVNSIRNGVLVDHGCDDEDTHRPDPVDDRDAAWAAYERMRNTG